MEGLSLAFWRRFEPFRFFLFWYQKGLSSLWRGGWELSESLWQTTAPFLMLRLLFTPLFGDYSWQGLVIGVVSRLFRAVVGLGATALVLLGWLLGLALWLFLPPFLFYLLLRPFFLLF